MKKQETLMKFDPETGDTKPYPGRADDWRKYHGSVAWLYNPWSGDKREAIDIGTDVHGFLILPLGETLCA